MTNPVNKAVTELKVLLATAASAAAGVAVAVLNVVAADPTTLLGATPDWLEFVLLAVVPPLATYVAGYLAPHTERPDLHPVPHTRNPLSPRN